MAGSAIRFYADLAESRALFTAINDAGSFKFTSTLSEVGRPLVHFEDAGRLMEYLRTADLRIEELFLITDRSTEIVEEQRTMADGSGIKKSVSQAFNPDSVKIKLGGELEGILIAHSINSTGETPKAKQIFAKLKKLVTQSSTHVNGFYVFPGALEKLKEGWRLTPDPSYAPTMDLEL